MNIALLVLALVQQPRDTVVLNPVVVTATRVPMPSDVLSSAVRFSNVLFDLAIFCDGSTD